jgi:hypothetical protein
MEGGNEGICAVRCWEVLAANGQGGIWHILPSIRGPPSLPAIPQGGGISLVSPPPTPSPRPISPTAMHSLGTA